MGEGTVFELPRGAFALPPGYYTFDRAWEVDDGVTVYRVRRVRSGIHDGPARGRHYLHVRGDGTARGTTRPQSEASLVGQLRELADVADREGLYDAGDWVRAFVVAGDDEDLERLRDVEEDRSR